jgi:DNA-binding CsgD family transcriptional regulator
MQFTIDERNSLKHYGILRRSGRYPWGSGGNVPERSKTFLDYVKELLGLGLTEAEIAQGVGLTTKELREAKTIARAEYKASQVSEAQRLKDKGLSTSAIAKKMELNESTVRGLLVPGADYRQKKITALSDMLREQVDEKQYVDVGKGVSNQLGISNEDLGVGLAVLKDEGYSVHTLKIEQAGTGMMTEYKVLVPPGVTQKDAWMNRSSIKQINEISIDKGETYLGLKPPMSIDSDRVAVRYAEEGGTEADGTLWVRPGVEDVSIGANSYAQVRVAVDGTHFIKGVAVYKDDLPKGVDVVFNTNKSDTGNKLDALKPMKTKADGTLDTDNPFGSAIKRQILKLDENGNEVLTSSMNIVNEEGDWGNWSSNFSSQMLSKQSTRFAKQQLDVLYENRRLDFDEIDSLTNPEIKRKLLLEFADSVDADAVQLQAASLPRTSTHVLIPMDFMKDTEVYAPNFRNGERVALIRHPHGGIFEIPELIVNNSNPKAKALISSNAADAIGINKKIADRLSGADFDGDTVLVIPNDSGQVRSKPALKGLVDYDAKALYKIPPDSPIPRMTEKQKQMEMGKISNLITDMTIAGASDDDIARAVRHSMVVIDAEKHELNYKQSELDNGIKQLREKYVQGKQGAATIVSRAGSPARVPERRLRKAKEGGPIDKKTGEVVWVPTNRTYVDKNGKTVAKTTKVEKLALAKDAHELVSDSKAPIEVVYANHSNRMKALANQARKEAVNTRPLPYNPSAKAAYSNEVASLNSKLNVSIQNKPRERQAQVIADQIYRAKKRDNPNMTYEEEKKVKGQALVAARTRVGAKKEQVKITPKEWEAIQAGAISPSKLREILANADTDQVKKLATPRTDKLMTSTKIQRAQSMSALGYTQAQIADALGVSLTTLKNSLSGGG